MDYLHAVLLALLQGLTEFLPISSSAHLILLPKLFSWPDQGLAFDVAVHVGTLFAVTLYFKADIRQLSAAWWADVYAGRGSEHSRLAWAVLVATVPVLFAGFIVNSWLLGHLRNPLLIAVTTLGFAIVLLWADLRGSRTRNERSLTLKQAVFIGCAQAVALIPGTSRSGVTITAGLAMGLTRKAAARFSFLLSIPVIVAAGAVELFALVKQPEAVSWPVLLLGTLIAAITAYLTVHFFLTLVERVGLMPFVIYRILLAVVLFYLFW